MSSSPRETCCLPARVPGRSSSALERMDPCAPRMVGVLPPVLAGARSRSSVSVTLGLASVVAIFLGLAPGGMAWAEASKTPSAVGPAADSNRSEPPEAGTEAAEEPSGPTHRYARIPKRNAFGIKPPAPALPPPEPEKEPPKDRPEFFLTGFTTVRGEKRAFVAYQPKGKPVQYPRALVPDEEVGIGDSVLKLVSIDPIEKSVTIAYNGEEIPLNFKDNAVKVTGAPGAAPVPGAPGGPPSALRGSQPPPPVLNPPGNVGGIPAGVVPGGGGVVPGAVAPTVIGRGGAVLSGGVGAFQGNQFAPNAIQAGGTPNHNGVDVPAVAPAPNEYGGTIPTPITRTGRVVPPPPPAPFPGLPGQ